MQPPLRTLQDANAEFVENVRDGSKLVDVMVTVGNKNIERNLNQFQARLQVTSMDVERSLTDLGERIRRVRVPEDIVASEVRAQVAQVTGGLRELQKAMGETVTSVRDLSVELRQPPHSGGFWDKFKKLFS